MVTRLRPLLPLLCLALALPTSLAAQEGQPSTARPSELEAGSTERTPLQRSLDALAGVQRNREQKQVELERVRQAYRQAATEEERQKIFQQVEALQDEIDRITLDYETIATGIDLKAFDLAPADQFDMAEELQTLVQPIVEELKAATEEPRRIERLRSELGHLERKEQVARQAVRNIQRLLDSLKPEDPLEVRASLEGSLEKWQQKVDELANDRSVKRYQYENRLAQRTSIVESTRSVLGNFFRTRGLNLVLALASFLLVLIVMRTFYLSAKRLVRKRVREEASFYSRVFDVVYALGSGTAAVVAALLALYATGDWVLLGVALLFLVGVAWAGKTAVPMFLEQIRLLLNFGTVRERERVTIDGVPYRVSRLSFYTLLSNSELAGGVRRLPLRDLIEMRSRVCSKDEIWFPCKRHDWVLLSDGRRGEVKHQSPDSVQLELLGGSRVTYPTADFLALAPENLSQGFRLTQRFGIDYKHQAISTSEVPGVFTLRVRAALEERFGADAVNGVKVEFVEAGASSLDYLVLADMAGSVARDYEGIKRVIQRAFVDTCNEKGWEIPFTQVTLHQAD